MIKPYPLKLKAPIKNYIWGGSRLKTEFGFNSEEEKIAEAWVLSCNKDGESTVLNGELKGKTLSSALREIGLDHKNEFPILIKLIDANDFLSIQVHPDEIVAKQLGAEPKNEMWYILDAQEDAFLYCGFNRYLTEEELKKVIENNDITSVLNKIPVKKGDAFYIPSGTVHAIGKGILIAEVQQDSNTTYRVYDYDRTDKFGNKRELHIDKALKSICRNKFEGFTDNGEYLCNCEYFKVSTLQVNGEVSFDNGVNTALLVVSGNAEILYDDTTIRLSKGDSLFIPSRVNYKIIGQCELLVTEK